MDILESLKSASENGVDASKNYVDASYNYSKLKAFQVLSYSLSSLIKLFFIGSLLSAALLFISVAGAIALGDYYNNMALGYVLIGLFLLIIGIIVYALRKTIDKNVITKLSQQFFESK
jgi:ABC-type Mn2+/Zn2+ transport system permease subunit